MINDFVKTNKMAESHLNTKEIAPKEHNERSRVSLLNIQQPAGNSISIHPEFSENDTTPFPIAILSNFQCMNINLRHVKIQNFNYSFILICLIVLVLLDFLF